MYVFQNVRKFIPSLKGLMWLSLLGLVGIPLRAMAQRQPALTVQTGRGALPSSRNLPITDHCQINNRGDISAEP